MEKKSYFMALIIGVLTYWFMEGFFNLILHINVYIFYKLDTTKLPWLIFCVAILLGELIFFLLIDIQGSLKLRLSLYLAVGARILIQFYFFEALLFLFEMIFFITILFLFIEIFKLYRSVEYFNSYETLLLGFIIGITVQLSLNIALYSSSLTTDMLKIPITFACSGILVYFSFTLSKDLTPKNEQLTTEKKELPSKLPELKMDHFILLGMLAFLATNWIFNPMTLSAYDSINLNRSGIYSFPYYSFTFYALLGVISLCASFVLVRKILSLNDPNRVKIVLIAVSLTFWVLVLAAFLSLSFGPNRPLFAPILLSAIVVAGTFWILLITSVLFHTHSFPRGFKPFVGFFGFLLAFVASIVAVIVVTWSLNLSLLYTIVVVIALSCAMFLHLINDNLIRNITGNKITFPLKLKAYLMLLILLIVIIFSFAAAAQPFRVDEGSDDPLFMTWNIHNAVGVDDKFDIDRIIEEIKEQDPDVVGLNEVDLGAAKTGFVDIASYIAQKLQMYYYFGPAFCNHYGNAIFSKYPIESAEDFNLPYVGSITSTEPRAVIQIKIKIDSKTWTVYQTHLSLSTKDRMKQVDFILDLIKNDDDDSRVVWMGDFNFAPDSDEYKSLNKTTGETLLDTHLILHAEPDLTCCFNENNEPQNRIDFILCSPDLTPQKSKVVCTLASDHCKVLTQF